MRIATSLALTCAGAILATAIEFDIPGIDLGALGTILFLVGLLGLAVTVGLEVMANRPWDRPRREPRRRRREEDADVAPRRPVEPPYDPVVRPSPSPPRRGVGPDDPTRVAPRRPPPGDRR